MKNKINKIIALSFDEWSLLFQILLLLPVVALMLTIFGYKRCQQFMRHFIFVKSIYSRSCDSQDDRIRIVYRMVNIVVRYGPYSENCLKRSLLLWWLLARDGIDSEIIFGVNDNLNQKFSAHAWVRCNGKDLFDQVHDNNNYVALN
ncbi:MAG: hypothetical protein ACI9N9_002075 [Enterobacterales bacterium]|jgi:hypothetical protein